MVNAPEAGVVNLLTGTAEREVCATLLWSEVRQFTALVPLAMAVDLFVRRALTVDV
jgi:hypothetical protein